MLAAGKVNLNGAPSETFASSKFGVWRFASWGRK